LCSPSFSSFFSLFAMVCLPLSVHCCHMRIHIG
jgi:hypothetical protein